MKKFRFILAITAVLTAALTIPASSQIDSSHVDQELASASRSLNEGHVKDGVERIVNLLREIDPAKDKEAYWRTSATLIEALSETENHSFAGQVIHTLATTKIPESQPAHFQWMQFYLGRNLAYTGKSDEGEKVLRALTAGDQRFVLIPAQRAAALVLSTIELDRGNIEQSAIWMRRAVIGTLVDKRAASEEIVDVLTRYANYLTRTRNFVEADVLFRKLTPIYDNHFAHHGSKYLRFGSNYLNNLTALGNFPAADVVLKALKDNVAAVDIVGNGVSEEIFFQELYQLARARAPSIADRLKDIVSKYPDFLKQPRNRIVFSYFALVAGDVDLADQFNSSTKMSAPVDEQFASYDIIIRSLIAAERDKFGESITLAREALDRIRAFHRAFENESSGHLPAISIEERLTLGLILGIDASHTSTFDQANFLFQLEQYLTRDKGKLGLNAKVALQTLKSDLQREDIRSRDRLQSLRDIIMEKAADSLIARVLPIRGFAPEEKNDYASLTRLEQIEDRISVSNEQLLKTVPDFLLDSADSPIDLATIQRLVRPNEALVLHIFAGAQGFVTTCIESDRWTFNVKRLDPSVIRQLDIDYKLLLAAVHATQAPSPVLDSEFPFESAYRLYQNFLGNVEACLQNKTHILLATDPDFFSLPWNALLTKAPSENDKVSYRDAAWLPKTFAISLLPSVRSLLQLRTNLSLSRARNNFLGIGAPDFNGVPVLSKQIALAPLFVARGIGNRQAIQSLPALPDTAEELRTVAEALGPSRSRILLGAEATERELRKQSLNDYRVISFATHAAVAGEIEGITEPALVLTPGADENNANNDGLLTATEIANLTLDANLVILSACNTAASDGRAAGRGLSGLADAFFFAGTRSIAVTQWPVFSNAAKQLGAGLISHSIGSHSAGVADGLRRTMVDYISSVKEDYLAHPRFWAAFMIAGDGAVRPLDSAAATDESQKPIKLDWDYLLPDVADDDIFGLAKGQRSNFAIGLEKPPAGEKRAGSYFARISPDKNVTVISRDHEMAASGIVSIDSKIGLLGYYPHDGGSSAVFRLLEQDGRERWRYVEDSDLSNHPISIIKSSDGYLLSSVETGFSPSTRSSTLVLNLVSESGAPITQRRIPISIEGGYSNPKNVAIDAKGNLIIAVSGRTSEASGAQSTMWTNPRTGSKHYCLGSKSTALVSIEMKSLQLRYIKMVENEQIVSVRERDGHLYGAISFATNCRLEMNIKLAEITTELELKPIFQTSNVNSIDVKDLTVTGEFYVLVGTVQTFLPTALAREIISSDKMLAKLWDDSYWEITEDHSSAFVLVVRKDGTLVADRVFPDLRYRSISAVAEIARNQFLAVGSAFGDRGWMIVFSLSDTGSTLWNNLLPSVKPIFDLFRKRN